MATFTFKAVDENDRVIQGTLNAPSENLAMLRLKKVYKNVLVLREEQVTASTGTTVFQSSPKVSYEALAVYTRQLATMIEAGISINRCLRFLTQGESQNLNLVLARVAEGVEQGKSLSKSMAEQPRVFNDTYIAMVKAGETSGGLDVALKKLADLMEKVVTMKKRIQSTFAYPAVIFVVCCAVIALFVFYILPMMLPVFLSMGVSLPWPTRLLVFVVNTARDPRIMVPIGIVLAIGIYILITVMRNSKNTPQLKYMIDLNILKIPVAGKLLMLNDQSRVLYTMATLLDAGVSLTDVLATLELIAGNQVLTQKLGWARRSMLDGASVFRAFEMHDAFPQTCLQMIKVGEETGNLSDMVRRIGKLYEEDVEIQLDNLASMLEPMIMAFMGTLVGFVAIAAFMPMVELLANL
ncbi:MAG: type II secretion system F family protein [Candidatus Eremiobacteraeota bacterium]|nr:type II secretion system F family protein [Candidatus Eremiobacteraeota bacterium]MCW5868963.1 type II secretion system F family protein [Candidatus Eremiobacteraeota bacterium]